ncbi:hypothetical protein AVEN_152820-1, partial [Araneus ventricosus]
MRNKTIQEKLFPEQSVGEETGESLQVIHHSCGASEIKEASTRLVTHVPPEIRVWSALLL